MISYRVWQDFNALRRRDVEQHATRHQRAHSLDAQLRKARARGNLVQLEAVVQTVAYRLMAEGIELRADLPDL